MLSAEQKANYTAKGYTWPVTIMSVEEAARYRQCFERYEAENGGWYELSKGQKLYLLQRWVADLVSHDKILDAVADVLGPDVLCWAVALFVKEAGSTSYVSWHQDSTYWGLSSPDVVTAWLALSPATLESGCMKMVPGGAELAQMPHHDSLASDNLLSRGQEIMVDVDDDDAEFAILEPGQISLHNIRTVHASEPNHSADRRIGLAIRYIAPHVYQTGAKGDSAWLVRGSDEYGHFIHETPARSDMDESALAEYARIMKLRQGVLYQGVQGKPAHVDIDATS
ncbi:MAG: phytanoyl-CoA dioxygenase family protein [Pseudomonadota bacterium]